MTTEKLWTVNAIKAANREAGYHWFDPSSMRFFGTKIFPEVYQGPGGIYFITSDKAGPDERDGRQFTVRTFEPETGSVGTASDDGMRGFKTKSEAVKDARTRAVGKSPVGFVGGLAHEDAGGIPFEYRGLKVTSEEYQPVTVEAQFAHDLQRHTNPKRGTETTTVETARHLMRLARRHHKMMEDYCNGVEIYDQDGEPLPALRQLRGHIAARAKAVGCVGVIFSGDPRGCTVKLTFADGFTNDFVKEGYCVPLDENDA